MRQLSKERWKKIHGIREPKDPEDAEVVARRYIHEAIVRWEIKWIKYLHMISASLAFGVVLLPNFIKGWHGFIASIPVASWVQREFSSLSGTLLFCLAVGLLLYFYSAFKIDGKNYSEYNYPINLSHIGSPQEIERYDLYPRTKLEERVFFADSAGGLWGAIFVWFGLFGGFSIILNAKG